MTGTVRDRDAATTAVPDGVDRATQPPDAEAPITELLGRVSADVSRLFRTHLELAKLEVKDEVARAGRGAGMMTGGAIAALIAVVMLSLALAWGLAEVVDAGWAFLIVGLLWAGGAAVLALVGRNEVKAVEPVPVVTRKTVEDDVTWAKERR